jgi:hypothetical protein
MPSKYETPVAFVKMSVIYGTCARWTTGYQKVGTVGRPGKVFLYFQRKFGANANYVRVENMCLLLKKNFSIRRRDQMHTRCPEQKSQSSNLGRTLH